MNEPAKPIHQNETHMGELLMLAAKKGQLVRANYTADSLVGIVAHRGKQYRIEIREER